MPVKAVSIFYHHDMTLFAMKGYELDGQRVKTIQAVNAARKHAVANGMSMEEAMRTITDETIKN